MERTKPTPSKIHYDTDLEPIILSKPLLDQFLQQEYGPPADLIALYTFYYYTAKWQRTNQPKATTGYAAKGLQWGEDRVRRTKKILKHLGLIKDITTKRKSDGQVTGHYIKINFIWTREKSDQVMRSHPIEIKEGGHPPGNPHCGQDHPVATGEGNASSDNSKNASSDNSKNASSDNSKNASSDNTSDIEMSDSKSGIPSNGGKPTAKERNKQFLPFAKQLSQIICTQKDMKHTSIQISKWSEEFRKLVEGNAITQDRVQTALDWYEDNVGGEYIPVIESGSSFRSKFIKLEAAIEREKNPYRQPQLPSGYIDKRNHSYVKEV